MKLKTSFVTQQIEDTQFLVPLGPTAFKGILRGNRTAAFIIDQLKRETTEAQLVEAVLKRYDVPRETVAEDVTELLRTLRQIGALEE